MTYRVCFYAEQAFLSQAKAMLEKGQSSEEVEVSAMCVLACASAIEALSNSLLSKVIMFRHFDELRIASKVEHIRLHGGQEPSWGEEPWGSVLRLIKLRNWLAHYKDHDNGLVNSEFVALKEPGKARPTFDCYEDLTLKRARQFYDHSRAAMLTLVQCSGANEGEFDYLRTEQYVPVLIG
ncbi:hypothetical protein [Comamonas testosteroni]|uniref:hypothetical protein n=1 Tax=Comamonas testosteroni TaxID=285 RepID=UPI0026F14743|nr:hypothetical protein [Comamonas testosteroni]WQD44913.1 hypothetical protein U0024_09165 [Comamonas testosteroni]